MKQKERLGDGTIRGLLKLDNIIIRNLKLISKLISKIDFA